jgi:hypothetical protein
MMVVNILPIALLLITLNLNARAQGGQVFGAQRLLTSAEVADLEAGYWWVSVITPEYPNGEIRRQLTVVPEPTIVGLAAFCCAVLLVARKRSSR